MSLEKVPKAGWAAAGAVLILVVVGVVLLATKSSSSADDLQFTGSGYPGIDAANTRQVGGPLDTGTVSNLAVAWTLPLTGEGAFGSYASSPIVSKGVAYSQDLASNVQAIALASGEVQWTKRYELPSHGPNGLVVADGRVYGATPTSAFALDQETGKELWSVPLARNDFEGIDMAPGYHDGLVYVSTVPVTASADYGAGSVGILWALDAKTGRKAWHFNTVPDDLWGNKGVNSGGGLWYPPAFDDKGFMYFGTGNPGPLPGTAKFPWGSSRPGPNLYADSVVKLDAKTGKLQWYYQQTPHNIYDWDLQNSPVLVESGGRQLVIASGKSGVVVALDRQTGKVVWKRPVGIHNGHDDDSLYAMRGEYSKLKTPTTVFPGELGGVIAPPATDGKTLFVPVVNHSMTVVSPSEVTESSPATGELVALDLASGDVKWQQKFSGPAYGAPTVVNDLVFATTFEGSVFAFEADSGNEVWTAGLPAGTNAGVTVNGNTLLAPAGLPVEEGQIPEIVAYRLGG